MKLSVQYTYDEKGVSRLKNSHYKIYGIYIEVICKLALVKRAFYMIQRLRLQKTNILFSCALA